MLCDTDRKIGMMYGACESPQAATPKRITYVIDQNGVITHTIPQVDPRTHTATVLEMVS